MSVYSAVLKFRVTPPKERASVAADHAIPAMVDLYQVPVPEIMISNAA